MGRAPGCPQGTGGGSRGPRGRASLPCMSVPRPLQQRGADSALKTTPYIRSQLGGPESGAGVAGRARRGCGARPSPAAASSGAAPGEEQGPQQCPVPASPMGLDAAAGAGSPGSRHFRGFGPAGSVRSSQSGPCVQGRTCGVPLYLAARIRASPLGCCGPGPVSGVRLRPRGEGPALGSVCGSAALSCGATWQGQHGRPSQGAWAEGPCTVAGRAGGPDTVGWDHTENLSRPCSAPAASPRPVRGSHGPGRQA